MHCAIKSSYSIIENFKWKRKEKSNLSHSTARVFDYYQIDNKMRIALIIQMKKKDRPENINYMTDCVDFLYHMLYSHLCDLIVVAHSSNRNKFSI